MLYNLIIAPIETIVDWIFVFITSQFSSVGIIGALVGVSLLINILALPLYNIADSLQAKERKIAKALEPRVKRIKKAFKGDEQFMMLSTYYSQNNYHPLYVLRSSLSILIEIPFFIAAYHYLSNCEALRGASFWIFKDLGSPDGLLHIGNFPIHVLPIIMTLINFVSGAIYTKECTTREKVQLYVVAILFLVLLYTSPSGLVLYWIMNNTFSLVKNIVMRRKHPGRILFVCVSAFLFLVTGYFYICKPDTTWYKKLFVLIIAIVFTAAPFVIKAIKNLIKSKEIKKPEINEKQYLTLTMLTGLGLALLCGLLLPSSVIASSTSEFCFLGKTPSPASYVWSSFFIFTGFFVFWPFAIYKMFGPKVKKAMPVLFFTVLLCALANAFIFKSDYGTLNILFMIGNPDSLNPGMKITAITVLFLIAVLAIYYVAYRFNKLSWLAVFSFAICIAEAGMGFTKLSHINKEFKFYSETQNAEPKTERLISPVFNLSKKGKNVVVVFLDRAINSYAPQIFENFPDINNSFDGFTYFPNTLSFSDYTVMGTPPMMGGYEYTFENMNGRSDELLRNKNDEANLVSAKLFADAGFETTLADPPWAGYSYGGDITGYKKYSGINVIQKECNYYTNYTMEKGIASTDTVDIQCKKEIVNFCTLEALPPFLRKRFYKDCKNANSLEHDAQAFYETFADLYYLPQLTDFTSNANTYSFFASSLTHDVGATLNDDYETVAPVDSGDFSLEHYQANIAAYKQLAKWFDYLKENQIYDNTRIIIVSDHGSNVEIPANNEHIARFSALLLFKDFDSHGNYITDDSFMTNADTLFLAKKDLDISNTNPFTKKILTQDKDNGINVHACLDWNAENFKNDKQFKYNKDDSFHVSDDIYNLQNWIPLDEWEKTNGGAK